MFLKDKWAIIDKKYNYQTGAIYGFSGKDISDEELITQYQIEAYEVKPKIIHYTFKYKPWINHKYFVLLREKYWFYYQLSWEEIKKHHQENLV